MTKITYKHKRTGEVICGDKLISKSSVKELQRVDHTITEPIERTYIKVDCGGGSFHAYPIEDLYENV